MAQPSPKPSVRFEVKPTEIESPRISEEAKRLTGDRNGGGLYLYDDDVNSKPTISSVIRKISQYNPSVPVSGEHHQHQPQNKSNKSGTFMGVYMPCIQNIFGVLFFIRLSWIVGTAGVLAAFFIVFICCLVTFVTSISLSAIATNGIVPGGGPYFMISRNLGPEFGGAIGILFYLGTTVAGSMYLIGAVEILLLYLVPAAKIFPDVFNCYRLFGTGLLVVVGCIVLGGIRVVNKFSLPGVIVVLSCIFLTFLGIFIKANGSDSVQFCLVGDRMVSLMRYREDSPNSPKLKCNGTDLQQMFCTPDNTSNSGVSCDPFFMDAWHRGLIRTQPAVSGIMSGVAGRNALPKYLSDGDIITENIKDPKAAAVGSAKYYVYADMTTSFIVLIGVFFPSVTGIMAGSNRSGDLRDPSRSIPLGTILATTTSSCVYLLGTILFGASVHEMFVRDKFGESANGKLVIGCFLSTLGAGLQSLVGAPRLLQAIAKDGVIPLLRPFQVGTRFGEPLRAQLLTFAICELGILIAQLESLTALITQFFLMCYLSTNAACALQSLINAPNWRPKFRYYHWTLSIFGSILCAVMMFISHWWFALIAIAVGVAVYKYIEYNGAKKEWGDGFKGLTLSTARYALLTLEEGPPHTKNWRPQILLLMSTESPTVVKHQAMLAFTSQLKAGNGLTVIASVLQGDYVEMDSQVGELKSTLKQLRSQHKIKGFCEVIVSPDITTGISSLIQTSGLGGLKPNSVIVSWPTKWKSDPDPAKVKTFVETVRITTAAQSALLVLKNVDDFPENKIRLTGLIDIWWVVHDGGMLMLLAHLLKTHKVWRRCRLRLFTVAQSEDNSIKMRDDLEAFLEDLRIEAMVEVVDMPQSDISEYVYGRTMLMEERNRVIRQLRLSHKEMHREIQSLVDHYHQSTAKVSECDEREPESPGRKTSFFLPAARKSSAPLAETNSIDEDLDTARMQAELNIPPQDANNKLPLRKTVSIAESHHSYHDKPDETNVLIMNNAIKLNGVIKNKSAEAQLVFLNLPPPPRSRDADENYMEFVEVLTEGLSRVLLVRGAGSEVVTIYT